MTALANAISIGPGARVGPYEIVARRCSGGMADVWLARSIAAPWARVALKTPARQLAERPEHAARFAREAAIHRGLDHPNVVRCLDAGRDGDVAYLALEYVRGLTLRELLDVRRAGDCVLPTALHVIARLCDALEYLHERTGPDGPLGLVHGDVGPENVMVGLDGETKLIDFGLATPTRGGAELAPLALAEVTHVGVRQERLARLRYVAPERALLGTIDRRSDVYAVGVMLGELVDEGQSVEVQRALASIAAQATAIDPDARTASARALGDRVDALAREVGASVERVRDDVRSAVGLGAQDDEAERSPWHGVLPTASETVLAETRDLETPRPAAGTELDREVQELLREMRRFDGKPIAACDPTPIATLQHVAASNERATTRRPTDVFARARRVPPAMPDVFGAFTRRAPRGRASDRPPRRLGDHPEPGTPRATAAAHFDRGWAALRDGRPEDALEAWEAACALDPTNRTYSVDLRQLRKKLGR